MKLFPKNKCLELIVLDNEEILSKIGKNVNFLFSLADWNLTNNKVDKAINIYNKILRMDANQVEALKNLVILYSECKDFKNAISTYDRLAQIPNGVSREVLEKITSSMIQQIYFLLDLKFVQNPQSNISLGDLDKGVKQATKVYKLLAENILHSVPAINGEFVEELFLETLNLFSNIEAAWSFLINTKLSSGYLEEAVKDYNYLSKTFLKKKTPFKNKALAQTENNLVTQLQAKFNEFKKDFPNNLEEVTKYYTFLKMFDKEPQGFESVLGEEWYKRGTVFESSGKYRSADECFSNALKFNYTPKYVLSKARVLRKLGEYLKAKRYYNKYLEGNKNPYVWNCLGKCYENLAQFKDAYICYKNALNLEPDNCLYKKNRNRVGQKYLASELGVLTKALALTNEGCSYYRKGLKNKAQKYFREAVFLSPNFSEAWYNLGVTLCTKQIHNFIDPNFIEATKCFEKAVELNQQFPEALNNLGLIYINRNPKKAIHYFNRAIKIDPKNETVWNNLGVVYCLLKEPKVEEAYRCFKKALQINPNFPEAQNNFGVLTTSLGHLNWALTLEPELYVALYNKGVILILKGGENDTNWREGYEYIMRAMCSGLAVQCPSSIRYNKVLYQLLSVMEGVLYYEFDENGKVTYSIIGRRRDEYKFWASAWHLCPYYLYLPYCGYLKTD